MTARRSVSKATQQPNYCNYEDCTNKKGKGTRGYCRRHYKQLGDEGVFKRKEYIAQPLVNAVMEDSLPLPLEGAVTAYLRIRQAHAKVTQALYILEYPEQHFPYTLQEVLRDALKALEEGSDG